MGKWKLIAGVALVFVLGAMVGALGTAQYVKHRHPFFEHDPKTRKAFIMKRLSRKLDLTQAQKPRIAEIIDQVEEKARQHFYAHHREMRSFVEQGFAEMKKELSPEQQNKLEKLKQEFEKRRKNREKRYFSR